MAGGSRCVVFLSFVLSNGTMVSKKFDYVICMGLKTSSLFMMKKTIFSGFLTKFRWSLARVNVKFGKCICCLVCACFTFCLFVSLFLVTTQHSLKRTQFFSFGMGGEE